MTDLLTYTGLLITPDSIQSPICQDIGVAMGRITRYGGAIWCPLIFHSLLVAALIPETASDDTWGAALIHDACETVSGEIPRGWKTHEHEQNEGDLIAIIAQDLGVFTLTAAKESALIKQADIAALYGEVDALAHPVFKERWLNSYEPHYGTRPEAATIERSKAIAATLKFRGFADPSRTCNPESGQVKNFITLLEAVKAGQTKRARLALAATLAKAGAVTI